MHFSYARTQKTWTATNSRGSLETISPTQPRCIFSLTSTVCLNLPLIWDTIESKSRRYAKWCWFRLQRELHGNWSGDFRPRFELSWEVKGGSRSQYLVLCTLCDATSTLPRSIRMFESVLCSERLSQRSIGTLFVLGGESFPKTYTEGHLKKRMRFLREFLERTCNWCPVSFLELCSYKPQIPLSTRV